MIPQAAGNSRVQALTSAARLSDHNRKPMPQASARPRPTRKPEKRKAIAACCIRPETYPSIALGYHGIPFSCNHRALIRPIFRPKPRKDLNYRSIETQTKAFHRTYLGTMDRQDLASRTQCDDHRFLPIHPRRPLPSVQGARNLIGVFARTSRYMIFMLLSANRATNSGICAHHLWHASPRNRRPFPDVQRAGRRRT